MVVNDPLANSPWADQTWPIVQNNLNNRRPPVMPSAKKPESPVLKLSSFRQLRALAHPLRLRAFERLIDTAKTGKQLALELGKQPTHMYHHLGVLLRAGLVHQVGSRRKRGTTEKYFQAVSQRVILDKELFGKRLSSQQALIGQLLRVTLEEFLAAPSNAADKTELVRMIKRLRVRTTPKRAAALAKSLNKWLASFEEANSLQGDCDYAVTVAFYPLIGPEAS
jgi:DNA-binding transcriptional ArsR family regulator